MVTITVRLMVILEGKLLTVQQSGHYFWCLPGGKVDPGESVLDALRRESVEELGIVPDVKDLHYVQQFKTDEDREFLEFFFTVNNPADYANIDLSATTHGEKELDAFHFVDPHFEDMRPAFLRTEADDYMGGDFHGTRYRSEL